MLTIFIVSGIILTLGENTRIWMKKKKRRVHSKKTELMLIFYIKISISVGSKIMYSKNGLVGKKDVGLTSRINWLVLN